MFPFSVIVLIGMSGVGKTHWANIYGKERCVFSADEHIADRILPQMRKAGIAEDGEKIDGLATFVGKFGSPRYGGLAREEFLHRQKVYSDAEKDDLLYLSLDLPDWVGRKGEDDVLLYDTTGSFCEVLPDRNYPLYRKLTEHACIVYLACSEEEKKILLQRQEERPKPMVYNKNFFEAWSQNPLGQKPIEEEEIVPDDFLRFIFPKTIEYRRARYEDLADVTLTTAELERLISPANSSLTGFSERFLLLVESKLQRAPAPHRPAKKQPQEEVTSP